MVKEAQRTPLDDAFDRFWNHSSSRQPADDLLAAVRTFSLRATGYDEDTAQLVCMFVFQGLERFRRADPMASLAGSERSSDVLDSRRSPSPPSTRRCSMKDLCHYMMRQNTSTCPSFPTVSDT
jgi:hypothetical protein